MKVKVHIGSSISKEDAEDALYKALDSKRSVDIHSNNNFMDPAMNHQADVMKKIYDLLLSRMMNEISEEIDKQEV